MKHSITVAALAALLHSGCSKRTDHCDALSKSCTTWCTGDAVATCLEWGERLKEDGDQDACYDAQMRLSCDSIGDKPCDTATGVGCDSDNADNADNACNSSR